MHLQQEFFFVQFGMKLQTLSEGKLFCLFSSICISTKVHLKEFDYIWMVQSFHYPHFAEQFLKAARV